MEASNAAKLCRIAQKACRYTLIAKNSFRLCVPKVRFLLATLTYIATVDNFIQTGVNAYLLFLSFRR